MQILLVAVIMGAGFGALYLLRIRPWQLRWGATDDEVVEAMPGDEVVSRPTFDATRGVTVNARPEHIWPWLAQIGVRRAGWYSYDCLDNLCRRSAEQILPEFQHLQIGDVIPISPDGKQGMKVKALCPNEWMLWWDGRGGATWLWALQAVDANHTRLITRVRVRYAWLSPEILFHLLIEFADIVMMRKCMLGIGRRAERLAGERRREPARELEQVVGDFSRLPVALAERSEVKS
jgi:hypothetical protein